MKKCWIQLYKTGDLVPWAGVWEEIETGVLITLKEVMEGDKFGPLTTNRYGRGHYVCVEEY